MERTKKTQMGKIPEKKDDKIENPLPDPAMRATDAQLAARKIKEKPKRQQTVVQARKKPTASSFTIMVKDNPTIDPALLKEDADQITKANGTFGIVPPGGDFTFASSAQWNYDEAAKKAEAAKGQEGLNHKGRNLANLPKEDLAVPLFAIRNEDGSSGRTVTFSQFVEQSFDTVSKPAATESAPVVAGQTESQGPPPPPSAPSAPPPPPTTAPPTATPLTAAPPTAQPPTTIPPTPATPTTAPPTMAPPAAVPPTVVPRIRLTAPRRITMGPTARPTAIDPSLLSQAPPTHQQTPPAKPPTASALPARLPGLTVPISHPFGDVFDNPFATKPSPPSAKPNVGLPQPWDPTVQPSTSSAPPAVPALPAVPAVNALASGSSKAAKPSKASEASMAPKPSVQPKKGGLSHPWSPPVAAQPAVASENIFEASTFSMGQLADSLPPAGDLHMNCEEAFMMEDVVEDGNGPTFWTSTSNPGSGPIVPPWNSPANTHSTPSSSGGFHFGSYLNSSPGEEDEGDRMKISEEGPFDGPDKMVTEEEFPQGTPASEPTAVQQQQWAFEQEERLRQEQQALMARQEEERKLQEEERAHAMEMDHERHFQETLEFRAREHQQQLERQQAEHAQAVRRFEEERASLVQQHQQQLCQQHEAQRAFLAQQELAHREQQRQLQAQLELLQQQQAFLAQEHYARDQHQRLIQAQMEEELRQREAQAEQQRQYQAYLEAEHRQLEQERLHQQQLAAAAAMGEVGVSPIRQSAHASTSVSIDASKPEFANSELFNNAANVASLDQQPANPPATNTMAAPSQSASSSIPAPMQFTAEQKEEVQAYFRLRALNSAMGHIVSTSAPTHDLMRAVSYYALARESILGNLRPTKRNAERAFGFEPVTSSYKERNGPAVRESLTPVDSQPKLSERPPLAESVSRPKRGAEVQLTRDIVEGLESSEGDVYTDTPTRATSTAGRKIATPKSPKSRFATASKASSIFKTLMEQGPSDSEVRGPQLNSTAPPTPIVADHSLNSSSKRQSPEPEDEPSSKKHHPDRQSATSTASPATSSRTPTFGSGFVPRLGGPSQASGGIELPNFGAVGSAQDFMAQFGKKAALTAEQEKKKRKAEDFDSDDETEEQWERRDAAAQLAKRQELLNEAKTVQTKFDPAEGFSFVPATHPKASEETASPVKNPFAPLAAPSANEVQPSPAFNFGPASNDDRGSTSPGKGPFAEVKVSSSSSRAPASLFSFGRASTTGGSSIALFGSNRSSPGPSTSAGASVFDSPQLMAQSRSIDPTNIFASLSANNSKVATPIEISSDESESSEGEDAGEPDQEKAQTSTESGNGAGSSSESKEQSENGAEARSSAEDNPSDGGSRTGLESFQPPKFAEGRSFADRMTTSDGKPLHPRDDEAEEPTAKRAKSFFELPRVGDKEDGASATQAPHSNIFGMSTSAANAPSPLAGLFGNPTPKATASPNPFEAANPTEPTTKPGLFTFGSSTDGATKPGLFTFGSSTDGATKPSPFNFTNPTAATTKPNPFSFASPGGDNTWKAGSPLKFGSDAPAFNFGMDAPRISITSASPLTKTTVEGSEATPKPPANIFGIPKMSTDSSTPFGGQPINAAQAMLTAPGATSASDSRATSPGATTDTGGESAADSGADAPQESAEGEGYDLSFVTPSTESEEVLFDVKARVHVLRVGEKRWTLNGVGEFYLLKDKESKKARMVIKKSPNGQIALNANVIKGGSYKIHHEKSILMMVPVENGVEQWIMKVRNLADAQKMVELLQLEAAA